METQETLEVIGTRGFFRPTGSVSTGELADHITEILAEARAQAVRDVLVNIAALRGFDSPGPAFRRWAARRWAETLGPNIHVAMVARHEHICPHKTGLLVAAENGMHAHICDAETEAVAWLDAQNSRT
jgi:hypothetical protein